MAWRLANALIQLRNQINNDYPNRSKASDGTIGDQSHAAVASDHNPNSAGVVCAFDITHHPGYLDAHALAEVLRTNRHPNLRYIISNGRICSDYQNWAWRVYSGSNAHNKHIHVSVGQSASKVGDGRSTGNYDDTSAWKINIQGGGAVSDKIGSSDNEFNRANIEHYVHRGRYISEDPADAKRKFLSWFANSVTWLRLIEIYNDDPERDWWMSMGELGRKASNENWQGKLQDLTREVTDKQKTIDELNPKIVNLTKDNETHLEVISTQNKEIASLRAQLAVQSDDTKLLNGFGEFLVKLLNRLGVKK